MSTAFSKLGSAALVAAFTLACGGGETSSGFGQGTDAYQAPPVAQEGGSKPVNNLLGCDPESGCQGCQSECETCVCSAIVGNLDNEELVACIASPECGPVIDELLGAEEYGPEAQILQQGSPDSQSECGDIEDTCDYCRCVGGGDSCAQVCDQLD